MAPYLFPRQESSATINDIADGLIAAFVCFVVLLSLLCFLRFRRFKVNKKGNEEWNATPFRVEGGVRPTMTEANPLSASTPPFSRLGLTASIAMPEKCITQKPSSHRSVGKAVVSSRFEPSPLSPTSPTSSRERPLSSSLTSSRPRSLSTLNPAYSRQSRSSSGSTTSALSASPTKARPVRQIFDPVLPDELSLLRYGECLTVLRSFDDGWCLVARDTSRSSRASRLSAFMKSNGDNVDIGVVPAWVFIKPLKGIAVSRPFRTSSVNALDLGQSPVPAYARDAVVSWSNFA